MLFFQGVFEYTDLSDFLFSEVDIFDGNQLAKKTFESKGCAPRDIGRKAKMTLESRIFLPSLKRSQRVLAPENGWLEYDPFLLGFCPFSGAKWLLVSGRVYILYTQHSIYFFPQLAL